MDALRELNSKGHTVVLITHEMEVAEYANRIITIRDGLVESDVINDGKMAENKFLKVKR